MARPNFIYPDDDYNELLKFLGSSGVSLSFLTKQFYNWVLAQKRLGRSVAYIISTLSDTLEVSK